MRNILTLFVLMLWMGIGTGNSQMAEAANWITTGTTTLSIDTLAETDVVSYTYATMEVDPSCSPYYYNSLEESPVNVNAVGHNYYYSNADQIRYVDTQATYIIDQYSTYNIDRTVEVPAPPPGYAIKIEYVQNY